MAARLPLRSVRDRVALLAMTLLTSVIVGCGLNEYQSLADVEQERIKYLDEENQYLGDPVELPKRRGDKSASASSDEATSVFFRLPKGVRRKPDPNPVGTVLYQYQRQLTTAPDVIFGADPSRERVLKDLIAQFKVEPGRAKKYETAAAGRPGLVYDAWQTEDVEARSQIYLTVIQDPSTEARMAVGIVFRLPRSMTAIPEDAMKYSLKSLAIGERAQVLRQIAQGRNEAKPASPPRKPESSESSTPAPSSLSPADDTTVPRGTR